jgi:arsenate reductase-like glutaredoxin family protein
LESLSREALIKLVKETKMQLETAIKENDTLHNQLNELRFFKEKD